MTDPIDLEYTISERVISQPTDVRTALEEAVSDALSVATEQDSTYEYSCEPGSPYVRFLTDDLMARGVRLTPTVATADWTGSTRPADAVPDAERLAVALHYAMCDVSHHDGGPMGHNCHSWPKYPAIARTVVRALAAPTGEEQ